MKAILVSILVGLATLSAQAIPQLNLTWTQNNWEYYFEAELTDDLTGERLRPADIFINGIFVASAGRSIRYGFLPENGGILYKFDSDNLVTANWGGDTYSTEFFIAAPVGPRPPTPITNVPDAGSTAAMLCMALGGHWIFRKLLRDVTCTS